MKAVWTLAACVLTCGMARADVAPTEGPLVDLSRYSGVWFEIASLPQEYQADCVSDVKAEYTLLEDESVKVVNSCMTESGEIKTVEGRAIVAVEGATDLLNVSFERVPEAEGDELTAWDFSNAGQYQILSIDEDYNYALVGHPERSAGWILARTPSVDAETLAALEKEMLAHGYDTCQVMTTVQTDGMEESVPLCEAVLPVPTLVEVLEEKGEFTQLLSAINEAGLVDTLKADGPYTIFAPTDEAFDRLPVELKEAILADKDALNAILLGHVIQGDFKAADLMDKDSEVSMMGSTLTFRFEEDVLFVNGAKVVESDIKAQNGTIHVIDSVILMEDEDDDNGTDEGTPEEPVQDEDGAAPADPVEPGDDANLPDEGTTDDGTTPPEEGDGGDGSDEDGSGDEGSDEETPEEPAEEPAA